MMAYGVLGPLDQFFKRTIIEERKFKEGSSKKPLKVGHIIAQK